MRRSKWVGPLHLTTAPAGSESPWMEGCCCNIVEIDDETGKQVGETSFAKGYQIRYRCGEAVVIAWRSKHAGCPMGPRLWLRVKRNHLAWVLRGRPVIAPQRMGNCGQATESLPLDRETVS